MTTRFHWNQILKWLYDQRGPRTSNEVYLKSTICRINNGEPRHQGGFVEFRIPNRLRSARRQNEQRTLFELRIDYGQQPERATKFIWTHPFPDWNNNAELSYVVTARGSHTSSDVSLNFNYEATAQRKHATSNEVHLRAVNNEVSLNSDFQINLRSTRTKNEQRCLFELDHI